MFDCCIMLCVFFFFKQKTAYEMRISDWSSDVCSSDLLRRLKEEGTTFADVLRQLREELAFQYLQRGMCLSEIAYLWVFPTTAPSLARSSNGQIGSASCRERVCQYV